MREAELQKLQQSWLKLNAEQRIEAAVAKLPQRPMVTSSFGAQSIVLLKLFRDVAPDVPIWVIDTGFLFRETYCYIDQITDRLKLNIKHIKPELSANWLEARFGTLWEGSKSDIERYNHIVKVEPLKRAIRQQNINTWFSGLRWQQSYQRANRQVLERQNGLYKVHPIIDWSDDQVSDYIKRHNLPEHPLVAKGYASIGDWHSSKPVALGSDAAASRFNGKVRECGIHETW